MQLFAALLLQVGVCISGFGGSTSLEIVAYQQYSREEWHVSGCVWHISGELACQWWSEVAWQGGGVHFVTCLVPFQAFVGAGN